MKNTHPIIATIIAVILASAAPVARAQAYDSPIDFPDFLDIQRETSEHVAGFQTSIEQYSHINARIAGLGEVPDIEARLRKASGIAMDLVPVAATMENQIRELKKSLDTLITRFKNDAKAIPGNNAAVLAQQHRLEEILRKSNNLNGLSDENYSHVAEITQLVTAVDMLQNSQDFAGTPTTVSNITAYFNTRMQDLRTMTLSLGIVNATRAHLSGLLTRRAQQEGQKIAAQSVPHTPLKISEMLKATTSAILISDDELNKTPLKRSGNPFIYKE